MIRKTAILGMIGAVLPFSLVLNAAPAEATGGCPVPVYKQIEDWHVDGIEPSATGGQINLVVFFNYRYCPHPEPGKTKLKIKNVVYCWTWYRGKNVNFNGVTFDSVFFNGVGKYIDPSPIQVDDYDKNSRCIKTDVGANALIPGNMMGKWWRMNTMPAWTVTATILVSMAENIKVTFTYNGNVIRAINPALDPIIPRTVLDNRVRLG